MNWKEFAARFRALRNDPVQFADRFLSKSPVGHKGQETWLREANAYINILVPGNRFGKSVVEAMRHIHHNVYKIGARNVPDEEYETISVSISDDQAKIVFDHAKRLLATPMMKPLVKRTYSSPFPRIVFYNNAVMHCRSAHDGGKYIDGHAYRLVSIDEAGWLKNELRPLMDGVIIMRLAGGGMIDLVGTPKGYTDLYWYANRGLRGVKGYYAQRGSIYDNPYLTKEDLEIRDQLLAQSDPRLREQVLYGAFVSTEGMAFTSDQLDQAFQEGLPAHVDYVPGHRYVQAWDLGRRTDWTVGVTFDITTRPFQLVDFVRLQKVPWEVIYNLIAAKKAEYQVQFPVIDATGPGGDVVEEELTKRGVFTNGVRITNQAIKTDLINTLQTAMDHGRKKVGMRIALDEAGFPREVPDLEPPGGDWGLIRMPPIQVLVDEFGGYEINDRKLVQDCVMAVAMAVSEVYESVERPLMASIYGGGSKDNMVVCESGRHKDRVWVHKDLARSRLLEGSFVLVCVECASALPAVV